MADAARAEARRRRILQNSQNRLQKITGRIEEIPLENGASSDFEFPQPEVTAISAGDLTDDSSIFVRRESRLLNQDLAANNVLGYTERPTATTNKTENPDNLLCKLSNSKVAIVILAVLYQVFTLFNDQLISNFFFLPIFILGVTQFIFVQPTTQASMLTASLTLSGISSHKVTWILRIVQCFKKCFEDACIYLFVFVILQAIKKNFG